MSAPPVPPDFDLAEYGSGLQEAAYQTTVAGIGESKTVGDLIGVLEVLRAMVDGAEPVQGVCPACRIQAMPKPLVSELVAISDAIGRLGDAEKAALRMRARHYAEVTLDLRDGRIFETPVPCPFRVGESCLLESVRPFDNRVSPVGDTTLGEIAARSVEFGHAVGCRHLGLQHYRVEAALAIEKMLDDPAWAETYMAGGQPFREEALIPLNRDRVTEFAKVMTETDEPSGFPITDPTIDALSQIAQAQGLQAAIDANPGVTVLQQMMRLEMPYAYESEVEIDRWRAYYVETLREVADLGLDAVEAFDALRMHCTYPIGYQGRDCREILSEHGQTLIQPIVAAALPDLSEPLEPRKPEGRLRVGYLSVHLRNHNGSAWAVRWVENHGPKIESFVFNTGHIEDSMSLRFRKAADHYYHLQGDVTEAARFIKSLNLDVLIFTDLGMHGANHQFAGMRLAPVQCHGFGHPVTSGLPTVDYFLSAELTEAPGGDAHYSEKVVRLPGAGVTMEPRKTFPLTRTRSDFGLPDGLLVVMSQNPFKMVPRHDAFFARLSQELEHPIVFFETLRRTSDEVHKRRFERAGIRARWLPHLNPEDFHQVLQLADVFVDPLAWSGANTTLEAITYGKPTVTLPGEFYRGRHSYAFLTQANMGSLVAKDEGDYIRLVKDRDLQVEAVRNANREGPFDDLSVVRALEEWMLKASGR